MRRDTPAKWETESWLRPRCEKGLFGKKCSKFQTWFFRDHPAKKKKSFFLFFFETWSCVTVMWLSGMSTWSFSRMHVSTCDIFDVHNQDTWFYLINEISIPHTIWEHIYTVACITRQNIHTPCAWCLYTTENKNKQYLYFSNNSFHNPMLFCLKFVEALYGHVQPACQMMWCLGHRKTHYYFGM